MATGESSNFIYFADGKLVSQGYAVANWMLRDVRTNQVGAISPVLLDILCGWQGYYRALGYDLPIVTTSGLRTPGTNSLTEGAARSSFHITGEAHDGFVVGVPTDHQFAVGRYLRGGGVGWYPGKQFIHTDVGGVREWRG